MHQIFYFKVKDGKKGREEKIRSLFSSLNISKKIQELTLSRFISDFGFAGVHNVAYHFNLWPRFELASFGNSKFTVLCLESIAMPAVPRNTKSLWL